LRMSILSHKIFDMRRIALFSTGLLFIIASAAGFQADTLKDLQPQKEHPREAILITQFLSGYHYSKTDVDDSLSSTIFENLFDDLDPNRAYFLKEEIQQFDAQRYTLDEALTNGDLSFGYEVFNEYRDQALDRIARVYDILDQAFDFGKEEYYDIDRSDSPWPETQKEQDELWRKIIKNQALTYKLAGKEWKDIAQSLRERYQRVEKALHQYTSEDVFQLYMNAYGTAYDPHTNYFSPMAAEDFEINMSLSLEGIGARLTQKLDYTIVADIVPGGPAYKSKELSQDDKIIGVAQGDEGEFQDVIGWRLRDVVRKIRGPKGSVVRLQVVKASSASTLPDTIRLVRDKIKLEEQEAKAEVIPIRQGDQEYKLGVITIPSFYIDFDERNRGVKDYKSTTRDVKKLIRDLEEKGIDGLMIDLRYNGGGSLDEAVEMTGLFIPEGPVVQVKDMRGQVDKLTDPDKGDVFYDGPLSVLVNRYSASASEIFSGAIQDYKRGVVFGENSFGKGTVQNIVDLEPQLRRQLNRMVTIYQRTGNKDEAEKIKELKRYIQENDIALGQLKMTMAKFYRVTGKSTQRVGIAPDVHFPTGYNPSETGESGRPNALPWDEIFAADYEPTGQISQRVINELNQSYRQHLNEDPDLRRLVKEMEKLRKERSEEKVSLKLSERKEEESEVDDLSTTLQSGDFTDEENASRLSEDPYLKEGLKLLAELTDKTIG